MAHTGPKRDTGKFGIWYGVSENTRTISRLLTLDNNVIGEISAAGRVMMENDFVDKTLVETKKYTHIQIRINGKVRYVIPDKNSLMFFLQKKSRYIAVGGRGYIETEKGIHVAWDFDRDKEHIEVYL